ncbi:MAG: tRNA (adenosine(37)-N6)-threonylcarbamoyltransferase complex ATPase subunit type 1 TsaE [Desulfobacterales bacterium]
MKRLSFDITTHAAEETRALGATFGRHAAAGTLIALTGTLGSGKTAFTQGLARGLQVPAEYYITSPTFTLINEYQGRLRLYHVDLYRIPGPGDIEEIGLHDIMPGAGVTVIEWTERLGNELPARHVGIHLAIVGDHSRRMTITAAGSGAVALVRRVAGEKFQA